MNEDKLDLFLIRIMDLIDEAKGNDLSKIYVSRIKEGWDLEDWKKVLDILRDQLGLKFSFEGKIGLWMFSWDSSSTE